VRLPPRTLAGDSFRLPATQQQQKLSQKKKQKNNLLSLQMIYGRFNTIHKQDDIVYQPQNTPKRYYQDL
jgi:hypothetical protein